MIRNSCVAAVVCGVLAAGYFVHDASTGASRIAAAPSVVRAVLPEESAPIAEAATSSYDDEVRPTQAEVLQSINTNEQEDLVVPEIDHQPKLDTPAVPQHLTQLTVEVYDQLNAIVPTALVVISHISALDPSLSESELLDLLEGGDAAWEFLYAVRSSAPDVVDAILMYESDVVGRRLTTVELDDFIGSSELYQLLDYERGKH